MQAGTIETIFVSHTVGQHFRDIALASLEPNETLFMTLGSLQLALLSRYGMRAGAGDCKRICKCRKRDRLAMAVSLSPKRHQMRAWPFSNARRSATP
jgi:hypothetical protein